MKKVLYLTVVCALAFASCTKFDFDENNTAIAKENAENIFGMIDPKQDWRCIETGSIQVTANAPLKNITKIQILTESPFFNDQAKILAETNASKGDIVNINYEAPRGKERLIAACVDNNGNYFIQGFNTTDSKVSFMNSASTRAVGRTRAAASLPNIDEIELKYSDSFQSFNARRALSDNTTFSKWQGKNWENDRMWLPSGPTSSNGWTIERNTIYSDAPTLSDEDKATLEDIFNSSLYRDDPKGVDGRRNNLPLIREGKAVKFFNNHLVSNGKAAITLIPVQMASTEAHMCDIYYYYYKQDNIPSDISEADYIKSLPKYKAIDLGLEREEFSKKTNIAKDQRDVNFFRIHEYLLPYYGEISDYESYPQTLSTLGYKADTNFYRIHNASEGKNNYFTYADPAENLKDAYSADVEKQLWQVFTNDSDPNNVKVMLYNVYAKQFLYYNGKEKNGVVLKDIDSKNLDRFNFHICDPNAKQTDSRTNIYIFENSMSNCLKSVSGVWIGNGGKSNTESYLQTRLWSFEEYTGSSATAITDFELPVQYFPNIYPAKSEKASAIIPDGYRIGFLIRKDNGQTNGSLTNDKFGCLYGYGELNKEINSFGQFKSALTKYGMEENDPRMAMFTANGKTYLCFEEGSDTQYSDVILELGGVSTTQVFKNSPDQPDNMNPQTVISDDNGEGDSGIYLFENIPEDMQQKIAYTMCFEDRPGTADYDLNDVVLRCIRDKNDPEVVQLSILAVGATDLLKLEGIEGELVDGKDLGGQELHEFFRIGPQVTGADRFVNTLDGNGSDYSPVSSWYRIGSDITIAKFLSKIKVKNMSTGQTIGVPLVGNPPYAIIMPGDFDYPREYTGIEKAYSTFQTWVQNASMYNNWPDYKSIDNVVKNMFNK